MALSAQAAKFSGRDCGREAGMPCRLEVITEATYGQRIVGRSADGGNQQIAATLGVLKPVASQLGIGLVATAGLWNGGLMFEVGPRLRWYASPAVAVDVTPAFVARGRQVPQQGPVMLDAAVLYRNKIGLSVQLTSAPRVRFTYDQAGNPLANIANVPTLFAGVRLGSKPGRYGFLLDAVAALGTFVVFLIICSNGGCD
jgi:hypothetical protein